MATKPIFRVVDVPLNATAEQMAEILNGPSGEGYILQSLTFNWPQIGARAVFKQPARFVKGKWVRGDDDRG
jgi:hypothetical protein